MKRLIFALLFLPVLLVIVFLLTRMRWKWSKPTGQGGPRSEMIVPV